MLDINDLEQRWLRYKIKSYIPYGVIVVSLIVIASLLLTLLSHNTPAKTAQKSKKDTTLILTGKEANTTVPKVQQQKQTQTVATQTQIQPTVPTPPKEINTKHKIKLEPSLGFIKNMQQNSVPYYRATPSQAQQKPHIQQLPSQKSTTQTRYEQLKQEGSATQETHLQKKDKTIVKKEPSKITIEHSNTRKDITEVIQRFKKNNNPALSLFVAKKYYELGEYRQSYNYALITNQINSDIEASWIIFAKSLVKLGEKDMAIKTLQRYIETSESNNAQLLLDDIKQGKFR